MAVYMSRLAGHTWDLRYDTGPLLRRATLYALGLLPGYDPPPEFPWWRA